MFLYDFTFLIRSLTSSAATGLYAQIPLVGWALATNA